MRYIYIYIAQERIIVGLLPHLFSLGRKPTKTSNYTFPSQRLSLRSTQIFQIQKTSLSLSLRHTERHTVTHTTMATTNAHLTTPTKTPSTNSSSLSRKHQNNPSNSRFEAYNRLQAAAVAFGEKLPIPEIVALGGQSDGKSSLLEALLGFRFNVREVEMGTRRPLILQMVHDPSALEPRCRFQVSFIQTGFLLPFLLLTWVPFFRVSKASSSFFFSYVGNIFI